MRQWSAVGLVGAVFILTWFVMDGRHRGLDDVRALPYLTLRSLLRMTVAFVLSIVFSLVYGYSAATYASAARFLLPVLDVLQSVPILGFFPVAVLFFITVFNGGTLGLEAASVFLIFTSQCWNLTFGVYEALSALPLETRDAANIVGLRGWTRWRRLVLPAVVPTLVYNGIVSWAGGWYFVTASEIISSATGNFTLRGLGSFLFRASEEGRSASIALGITALVACVVAIEVLVWRPLQVWAERFKFEFFPGTVRPKSRVTDLYRAVFARARTQDLGPGKAGPLALPVALRRLQSSRPFKLVRRGVGLSFLGLFLFVLGLLAWAIVRAFAGPLAPDAKLIPLALGASLLRLAIAYAITVLWTVPLAIYIGRRERASRFLVPMTEVLASIPAVALFPLIVLVFVGLTGGLGIPSVLLVLTGMQWYLLFNLIAGARQVPNDLAAAAQVFGVKGWLLWKRLYLPAMRPHFITGSITAWGGGWNALIVSEFVNFGGREYHTFGIGYLINKATFQHTSGSLLLLSVFSMVVFIYALNRTVWKPLYRNALSRYRLEG
jgi:NitT/TauT family transport system permease protein